MPRKLERVRVSRLRCSQAHQTSPFRESRGWHGAHHWTTAHCGLVSRFNIARCAAALSTTSLQLVQHSSAADVSRMGQVRPVALPAVQAHDHGGSFAFYWRRLWAPRAQGAASFLPYIRTIECVADDWITFGVEWVAWFQRGAGVRLPRQRATVVPGPCPHQSHDSWRGHANRYLEVRKRSVSSRGVSSQPIATFLHQLICAFGNALRQTSTRRTAIAVPRHPKQRTWVIVPQGPRKLARLSILSQTMRLWPIV